MNRIIYCACGKFIPFDVQDMQADSTKKCIVCAIKAGIEMLEALAPAE